MAYEFEITGPVERRHGSDWLFLTWTITETDVGTSDEWEIEGLPTPSSLWLYECELTEAGSATSVRPEVGTETGFSLDTNAAVSQANAAQVQHHIEDSRKIAGLGDGGKLVGRSSPDDTADEIVTRVTILVGPS